MRIYAAFRPLINLANPNHLLLRFRSSVSSSKPESPPPVMEAKVILSQNQRYAAGALFALALHQTQIHQTKPLNALPPLEEESIGDAAEISRSVSVSDDPGIWMHESSGLLYPVLRFLGVEDQTWKGLKETAGSSSQIRHHVGAFMTLLKEEAAEATTAEEAKKEASLAKTVETMVLSEENADAHAEEESENYEYEIKCRDKFSDTETEISSEVADKSYDAPRRTVSVISTEIKDPMESKRLDLPVEEGNEISYEKKITILYVILSGCIADCSVSGDKVRSGYDARHRVALRLLATWLGVEWLKVEVMETMVAYSFMASLKKSDAEKTENVDGEEKVMDDASWENWKRGGLIGAAALTGGSLMAITGGIAAPAIAQGLSALAPVLGSIIPAIGATGFTAAATATGSVTGSIAVAASFGAAGAGLTGTKMARRTGNIEEFEFKAVEGTYNQGIVLVSADTSFKNEMLTDVSKPFQRLGVGIVVSGMVFEDEDYVMPWDGYNDHLERYALFWESKNLVALSTAIQDWLNSKIALELMKEGAMLTVLNTLVAALAMPATLVTASDLIDSKWAIAADRSDKAGKMLAEVLLKGLQGNRPVTLIGFSLGGRVIFKCLECLAEAEGNNAGLVERVVLLGAPVSVEDENWEDARKMVAGRFVNAFSTNDWTLGVAFRASLLSQGLAGIQAINVPGIENVDVTQFIEGHSSYLWKTKQILELLELDSYYPVFRREDSQDKTPEKENSSADEKKTN